MRRAAIVLAAALAGCQSVPEAPETVYVTVEKIVPVPSELTRPVPVYEIKAQTYGEAVTAANKRKAGQIQCNAKLAEIEALGP